MPIINTSAPSPGRQDYSMGLGAPKKEFVITEAVTLTQASPFIRLSSKLPPRCRIAWVAVANQTAVNVTGSAGTVTNIANGYLVCPTAAGATPTTGTVSNATASAFIAHTATASNAAVRRGDTLASSLQTQTVTDFQDILLLPYVSTNNIIQASGTSGLIFGAGTSTVTGTTQGGVVSVSIYVEQFDDVVGINY